MGLKTEELNLWGVTFVFGKESDRRPIGGVTAIENAPTFEAAVNRLRVKGFAPEVPPDQIILGVQPHVDHLGHLFERGGPFYDEKRNFSSLLGPACPVAAVE